MVETHVLLVEGEEGAVPKLELGKKKYFLFFFFFSFSPFMDRKKSIHPLGVCNAQFDVVEQRKGSVTAYTHTHTHTSQSIINKRMKTATHRIVQFPLCAFIL